MENNLPPIINTEDIEYVLEYKKNNRPIGGLENADGSFVQSCYRDGTVIEEIDGEIKYFYRMMDEELKQMLEENASLRRSVLNAESHKQKFGK